MSETSGLAGAATEAGTLRGAESFGAGARTLGRTKLHVTPIGFGGYRIADGSPIHRRALADALRGGVNLIDTSTNYTGGASERLVGRILANLVQRGEVRRDQVVVVSKVGYIQGDNLARVRERETPYPDVVPYADNLWHCIAPAFVRDQLEESLQRLGLAKLDVLLLHNPEYALMHAAKHGEDLSTARAELDRRLRAAFEALEQAVADGKIGWYGVSSNGFSEPADAPEHTSVARMVELAREVGGDDHHFAVIQLPMNLLELGAHTLPTGPGDKTPLQVAAEADLGVLVNRPLNAFGPVGGQERLVRLASGGEGPSAEAQSVESTLAAVRKLEAQWATGMAKRLVTEGGDDAGDLFRWGRELSTRVAGLSGPQHWSMLRHEVIAPHLAQTSSALLAALSGDDKAEFSTWWEAYGAAMHEAFEAIGVQLAAERRALANTVGTQLDTLLPEPWRAMPLSAKAVLCLLATPIAAVLVGMREPGYVADMLMLRDAPVRVLSAAAGAVDLAAVGSAVSAALADPA